MEFDSNLKKEVEKAKKLVDSVDNISDKEREILFGKIIDKILDSRNIVDGNNINPVREVVKVETQGEDIQELYHKIEPTTSLDTVMFVGYYFHKNNKPFTVGDLLEKYKLLLIPNPSNPSDLINKNRKKGLIMINGKNEEKNNLFNITRKGLSYVQAGYKEIKNG